MNKNATPESHPAPSFMRNILRWFDSWAGADEEMTSTEFNWVRVLPFIALHLACLAAFFIDVSTTAIVVCLGLFWLRLFAITAFYHRYFSHRSYKTNRFWQFIFALLGNMAAQRGPLWWAAHHRAHHQHADTNRTYTHRCNAGSGGATPAGLPVMPPSAPSCTALKTLPNFRNCAGWTVTMPLPRPCWWHCYTPVANCWRIISRS